MLGDECPSFDDSRGTLSFIKLPVLRQEVQLTFDNPHRLEVNREDGFLLMKKIIFYQVIIYFRNTEQDAQKHRDTQFSTIYGPDGIVNPASSS